MGTNKLSIDKFIVLYIIVNRKKTFSYRLGRGRYERNKRNYRQTNVNLPFEDYELMKSMMFSEGMFNRSAFIRRLIRQELQRRQNMVQQNTQEVTHV